MRYDNERYDGGNDYVKISRKLTPAQITRLQTGLQVAPADDAIQPQIVANQDNYPLSDNMIQLFTTDASRTITGFVNVGAGIKVIANRGAQNLVLADDDAGSEEQNRILCHTTGVDITLNPNESVIIYYDRESSRVRTVGFT